MPARRKTNKVRELHGLKPVTPPQFPDLGNAPEPPSWLPVAAKREWRRVLEVTSAREGWLQEVDRAALNQLRGFLGHLRGRR